MDNSFEYGGKKYKLSKISGMKQFHVVRKMAPILSKLGPGLVKIGKKKEDITDEELMNIISPVMDGLASLPDKDAEYVMMTLLTGVEQFNPEFNSWMRVANEAGLNVSDIPFANMMNCAMQCFRFNLQDFFSALPQVSHGRG